jgi:hypothetical protein
MLLGFHLILLAGSLQAGAAREIWALRLRSTQTPLPVGDDADPVRDKTRRWR